MNAGGVLNTCKLRAKFSLLTKSLLILAVSGILILRKNLIKTVSVVIDVYKRQGKTKL